MLIHCPLLYYTNDTARRSRVTSLLSGGDLLYVGTGGGAILVLDSTTMGLHRLLHAYTKPVRSLLLVLPTKQSPPLFRRLFSRKDSAASSHSMKSDGSDSPRLSRSGHPSLKSFPSSSSFKSSIEESSNPERAVLISLGVGYKGVIGEAENHPSLFMLPSEGTKNNTKLAKLPLSYGHLLLWSTETHSTGQSNGAVGQHCTDTTDLGGGVELPNLCELEEDQLESSD